jgi:hypothetical protein
LHEQLLDSDLVWHVTQVGVRRVADSQHLAAPAGKVVHEPHGSDRDL